MHRADAADDDHQEQVDRLDDVELVGRDEPELVRVERAADAGERRRDRERQRLVARQVDAHALRRDLGVADGDEGAAGRRAQQVEDRQRRARPRRRGRGSRTRRRRRALQPNALGAFTCMPALPPVTLSQRANTSSTMKPKASVAIAEVDALDAQRRQADDDAGGGRDQAGGGEAQRERPAGVAEHGFGVRADAEERGMAEREQAGVAGEQHQPEADDGVDQHEGELGEPVLGEQPRRGEQRERRAGRTRTPARRAWRGGCPGRRWS